MTVNVARRNRRRTSESRPDPVAVPNETLAIGEINQTVFDCPKCARPLAIGVHRCPGCRTRIVLGIPLAKASAFVSFGVTLGIAVGVLVGVGLGLGRTASAATLPAISAVPSQPAPGGGGPAATASLTATASSSAGPTSDMSAITRSALSQAIGVNRRLAAGAATLRSALDGSDFDASAVAETLRSISADSVFGQQLAGQLQSWSGSDALGRNLGTFYDSVHQTATDWLVASVRDEAAYRDAARAMLDVLKGLSLLDGEANALAGRVGLVIPPPTAP